jgi:hypothetical protein
MLLPLLLNLTKPPAPLPPTPVFDTGPAYIWSQGPYYVLEVNGAVLAKAANPELLRIEARRCRCTSTTIIPD